MTNEELFNSTAVIVGGHGYKRVAEQAGWCWEHGRSRVRLSAPQEANAAIPFTISRQRYDMIASGERVLLPQSTWISGEAEATPERLASLVEDQLENPY